MSAAMPGCGGCEVERGAQEEVVIQIWAGKGYSCEGASPSTVRGHAYRALTKNFSTKLTGISSGAVMDKVASLCL